MGDDSYVAPDRIGPNTDAPPRPFMDRLKERPGRIVRSLSTKEGLVSERKMSPPDFSDMFLECATAGFREY